MQLLSRLTAAVLLLTPLAGADEAARELEKLQGVWAIASWEECGKEQSDEQTKKLTIVIKDESIAFKYEGQAKSLVMKLKLDPSAKPKAVDPVSTLREGQLAAMGIYERDGDELKLIWSRNGMARPEEFSTKRGDDRIFVKLRLIEAKPKDK